MGILYACPTQYVFHLPLENCKAYEDAFMNRMSYYLGHIDGIITVQTVMNLLSFSIFCCPQSSWSKVGIGGISLSERIMLASNANSMWTVTWTIKFMNFMWYDTLDRHSYSQMYDSLIVVVPELVYSSWSLIFTCLSNCYVIVWCYCSYWLIDLDLVYWSHCVCVWLVWFAVARLSLQLQICTCSMQIV